MSSFCLFIDFFTIVFPQVILKRRTTLRHAQKSHIRAPRPPPRPLPAVPQETEEQPDYLNVVTRYKVYNIIF